MGTAIPFSLFREVSVICSSFAATIASSKKELVEIAQGGRTEARWDVLS
jgi:hypothetical protein